MRSHRLSARKLSLAHPQRLRRAPALEALEGRTLMAAGFLDPSFDGDGRVVRTGAGAGTATAVVVQSDGKIVIAGSVDAPGGSDFFVARYNTDGSPDTTFGAGGTASADFAGGADVAMGLALQSDGKIVAAGSSGAEFAVARFNPDGTLDASFDGDGRVTFGFGGIGSRGLDVAIQPLDQRIVVSGSTSPATGQSDFALARLMPDGSLDGSFGTGGRVTTGSGLAAARAVAVAPGNKIVAAGTAEGGAGDSAIARYNADGSLDATFNDPVPDEGVPAGIIRDPFEASTDYDEISDVAVEPDGSVLVAGHIATRGFTVVRYSSDGFDYTKFDPVELFASGGAGHAFARSVTRQEDGKVVAAGFTVDEQGEQENFAVVRYNPDGTADGSFSLNGVATTDFRAISSHAENGTRDVAFDVAVSPTDGSIVAAGASQGAAALARYLGDASTLPAPVTLAAGSRLSMTGTGDGDDVRLYPADAAAQKFVADWNGSLFQIRAAQAPRVFVSAGAGDDVVRAAAGPAGNVFAIPMDVSGGAGGDTIFGGSANDLLRGDDGNDGLDGGRGSDAVLGGSGDDLLIASETAGPGAIGDDYYSGGAGTDTISYAGRTARLNLRLGAFATGAPGERDTLRNDVERVIGGSGDDRLEGNDQDNLIFGGGGNDTILGRAGNDILLGEAGDDVLADYSGNNTLDGGEGFDTVNGVRESVPEVTLEAETATLSGPSVSRSNPGYTGTGYADFNAARGDYVEWTYDATSAGQRTLTFRYANGGATDRPLELRINGAVVTPSLSFAPTGAWTTWRTVTVTVTLAAGTNRIRLTSIGSNGGNIDSLRITG